MEIRRDLGYCPLVFFWLVEFSDGTALAQFDPETGKENKADPEWLPSAPNQPPIPKDMVYTTRKLVRFSWVPFSDGLALKVLGATGQIVVSTDNPIYSIDLKDGDRLVAYRTNLVHYGLKTCSVHGRETIYVFGRAGEKLMLIHEDGSVE